MASKASVRDLAAVHQLTLAAAAEHQREAASLAAAEAVRAAEAAAEAVRAAQATAAALVAVAVELVPVAPPQASSMPGVARHERVGREALSRLRHLDHTALGWTIAFHPGRPGYLGMADWETRTVDVWIRESHSVQEVLGTLAHELAHVLDYDHWTAADRDQWLALRDLDVEWWPPCTCDDRDFGAGDIAEAMVVLEAGVGEWTGHFGLPTQAQLDWLASRV